MCPIRDARLSRRDLIKAGFAVGGASLLAKGMVAELVGASAAAGDTVPPQPADSRLGRSPALAPWRCELPIQTPKADASGAEMEEILRTVNPAAHQRYFEFEPRHFYSLHVREVEHEFHPDLPPSRVFGYDGVFPGPLFHSHVGNPCLVRIHNELPVNHVGYGVPEISTHLHNSHTASESDGFPGDFYPSGNYRDHHYPMFPAGGDDRETLGTLWYHDHRVDFTAQNVYRGLAGFHLFFDERDSGDEEDTSPVALRLPSGAFDVPIVLADKRFDRNGQMAFDVFNQDGFLGDVFTVNGKVQPYLHVKRRKYRFRILDGGPSRFYNIALSDASKFLHIANDGNLLEHPVATRGVWLGVASRADIVVDFSTYRQGDEIYLVNRADQQDGRGPTGKLRSPGTPLVKFIVDDVVADPSVVPSVLRLQPDIDVGEVVRHRTWEFARRRGAWTVNGRFFDVERSDAQVQRGTAEIWTLRNGGGGWAHPVHIHFEEGRILSRNGRPPAPFEQGRLDVYLLFPGDEIKVFLRFRDFLGKYPMHCHNTVHEDHAMMVRWDIVDGEPS